MKKFLSVLVVFALCLSMAACSSNDNKNNKKDKEETTQEETEKTEAVETSEEPSETTIEEEEVPSTLEFIDTSISFESFNVCAPESAYTSVSMYYEHLAVSGSSYSSLKSAVERNDSAVYDELISSYNTALDEFVNSNYSSSNAAYIYEFVNVYRADSMVFSYIAKSDSNAKGDYSTTYVAHNINSSTGEEITLLDIVDVEAIRPVLFTYMEHSGDVSKYKDDWQDVVNEQFDMGTVIYVIAPDGVYFFFENDDIANPGFWLGTTSFKIPYAYNEDVLNGDYFTTITENYCLYADTNNEINYDIDGDEAYEYLSVVPSWDESFAFYSFDCIYNDNTITFEAFGYSLQAYVTHINGHNFLNVTCLEDNDFHVNYVFEITEDELIPAGSFDGSTYRVVNPEKFYLSMNINPLSTMSGYTISTTNDDGSVTSNGVYELRTTVRLINLVELEGEIIDADGTSTGETLVVPELSEFIFYSTDNDSYVDFKIYNPDTDSFDIVRFSVDLDWNNGQHIEGMSADECFTMLFYAG